jgi:signal transduction histidine kinase/ActR/RegA family two-component response regulator/HAMP domain-containing protein
MKRPELNFSSIRVRLLVWCCLLVLASLSLFALGVYFHRVESVRERAYERFALLRDLNAAEINTWIDRIHEDMEFAADDQVFLRACRSLFANQFSGPAELAALDSLFKSRIRHFDSYAEFFIIGAAGGTILYSTDRDRIGYNCYGYAYFNEAMKGREFYIRDFPSPKEFDRPSVTFSMPLHLGQSGPSGVLVGRIDLRRAFAKLFSAKARFGETGRTLIVDRDHVALNEPGEHDAVKLNKVIDEASVQALRGGTGIVEYEDYRGTGSIAAYTYIPRLSWGFMVKQDTVEVFEPARVMLARMTVLIVLLLGIASAVALLGARNLTRPVLSLIDVASKIQGGDLNARNPIGGSDELAYLARSFNSMADTIVNELNFQKTCSDLIEVMVATIDLASFSSNIIMKFMEITGSCIGAFYVLTPDGRDFTHLASIGLDSEAIVTFHAETLEGEFGRALTMRRITRTEIETETRQFRLRTVIGDVMPRELVTIPVIAHNTCVAIISLASLHAYPEQALRILHQIWPVMNTAFSNILAIEERKKLSNELEMKNRLLETKQDTLQRQAYELQRQTEMVRRQNYTLQEQRTIVEESNRLKTEFLSNMSHELRTPLNSILSLSRVLQLNKSSNLTEEQKGYVEIIERNGDHLLALINDILDLSKIESGRIDLRPRMISLRSVLGVIVENFEQLAEDKGISLKLQVPEDLPDIETDEARLYQILQNIIGNAVKFTEQGGVIITAARDGVMIAVNVADTGIGIAEEDLPRIFEEFRQIDGTLTRKYEGTGLGLAIAYKSAQLINAAIEVSSALGTGSTFTVRIPVSMSAGRGARRQAQAVAAPQAGAIGRKRVLVVEDDMDTVVTLRALLQDDYEIVEAHDGIEGLEKAGETGPDCILLDIALPRMNGYTVIERLKGDPGTSEIPVIAMTAFYLDSDRERILKAGCDDYLLKPFDIEGLKKTIEYWTVTRNEKNPGN